MSAQRNLLAKRIVFLCCFGAVSALGLWPAAAVPIYKLVPLGFDDLAHTTSSGFKYSEARQLNEAGQVIGRSDRFNGSDDLGSTAWLYNGASTIDIGLTGGEHTRSDGYKSSLTEQLNEAGRVRGYSRRYNGNAELGVTSWLYNGATTIAIGLTGAEQTRDDGYNLNFTSELNEAGHVIGFSRRFNGGSNDLGQSFWLYNGASTIDIGLTGGEHTRSDGFKWSYADDLNEVGQVRGYSLRYNGSNSALGRSDWLYNGESTIAIGLTGAEHTRNDGYKESFSIKLSEAGQVTGYSRRYNGSSAELGFTAWLYNGATTIDIGLTGGEHTRSDGYKDSSWSWDIIHCSTRSITTLASAPFTSQLPTACTI
jgi:hypothetical protein